MNSIEIKNVKAIRSLSIPIPEEGGVVVLTGRNGSGKTSALDAAAAALRGKGALELRDGTLKGSVEGLGATITVGKSTRRKGTIEVDNLEGRFSIAALVDPGIKSPEAADAARIKSLVTLTRAVPSEDLLDRYLGEHRELVKREDCESDLVATMATLKRELEAKARVEEQHASSLLAKADAITTEIQDIDLDIETDQETLQAGLREAMEHEADVKARQRRASELSEKQAAADQWIRENETEAATAAGIQEELDHLRSRIQEAKQEAIDAEAAFHAAEKRRDDLITQEEAKAQVLEATKSHVKRMASYAELLKERVDWPTDEEAETAATAVRVATELIERAAIVREAALRSLSVEGLHKQWGQHAGAADQLREYASSTDAIVQQAINTKALWVQDGRLVTKTDRGDTYYSDLSDGERWRIAIDIAADNLDPRGFIIIEQSAWEGLDADNRAAIVAKAKERRVVILAAQAWRGEGDDPDLHAVEYGKEDGN